MTNTLKYMSKFSRNAIFSGLQKQRKTTGGEGYWGILGVGEGRAGHWGIWGPIGGG